MFSEAARHPARHRVEDDEERVRGIWRRIYGDLVRLEDFRSERSTAAQGDNVEAILAEVNLLPKSVGSSTTTRSNGPRSR